MKTNLGLKLALLNAGFVFSQGVFAQDTLSAEPSPAAAPTYSTPAAPTHSAPASQAYSAPVQVVPADPDLWRPSNQSSSVKGAIVPPTETQTIPAFPKAQQQGYVQSEPAVNSSRSQSVTSDGTFSEQTLGALNVNENNSYASNLDLRAQRKIGLGAAVGGDTGMFGIKAEYNFEDADGATAAVGWGPGYQSFALNWKHNWNNLLDSEFSPYVTAGYSHWFNTGSGNYESSDILKQTLTEQQKTDQNFGLDFISGFAGLQYYVLSGEAAGLSFHAELGLMNEIIPVRNTVLTGGVGSTFYF